MIFPSKRKYPKKLNIGEHEWTVIVKKEIEDGAVGLCDYETKTISIKSNLNRVAFLSTLIHEVLHAFEEEYDIKMHHRVVYKLERAIMEFLIANC